MLLPPTVALALSALTYNLCHHLGSLPQGLGQAGQGTRVVDWIDVATPFLVLLPAIVAVIASAARPRTYAVLACGVILYAEGHGIHLAANSIGNVAPGPTAHLWDETVGHFLWYAGVAIVVVALASTMRERPRPHPVGYALALGTGLTWASNAVGAGLVEFAVLPVIAALWWGWRRRDGEGVLLAFAGGAGLIFLVAAFALGQA